MIENEIQEEQELTSIIEKSVDDSVCRAMKKYGRVARSPFTIRNLIALLLVLAVAAAGWSYWQKRSASAQVAPVEDHDLTMENNGIFGFTVADFEPAVLGAATRQRLLIVEEQEVYVNTAITSTGLFNWGIFNKQQALTIHGTGQYTIDLSQISGADITLNEDTYELTVRIPHAQLHQTLFDPAKTEVGDAQNGWLAFGDIKMTAEQQKEFEVTAKEQLETKLNEAPRFDEADRFARLSAYETYQPLVSSVSPAYKVVIEFQ